MTKNIFLLILVISLFACKNNSTHSDSYGNFEAEDVTISSEATGKLLTFNIEEGISIDSGYVVGYVDTAQLHIKRIQILALLEAVRSKARNILTPVLSLQEQKVNAVRERDRMSNLLESGAGTQKALDDLNGAVKVLEQQIKTQQDLVEEQNKAVFAELKSQETQFAQINDMVQKSIIINPTKGTVLNKLAEQNEITAVGRPLYKIAPLDEIFLRVYVSEDELGKVKLGQQAEVLVDDGKNNLRKQSGTVTWISTDAEFTPKIIQTKDERVNLVYAVKIKVKNDGSLKIGMPGEANFSVTNSTK